MLNSFVLPLNAVTVACEGVVALSVSVGIAPGATMMLPPASSGIKTICPVAAICVYAPFVPVTVSKTFGPTGAQTIDARFPLSVIGTTFA